MVGIIESENVSYHSISLPFSAGGQLSVPNFEKEGIKKKKKCLGGLKEFMPQRFVWRGLTMFFVKQDCEIKYGFEGSVFISDLGLC